MGSKNISITEDAYEKLRRARRHPHESFSQVIRRGSWGQEASTARFWLASFGEVPPVSDSVLEELETLQKSDAPARDKWSC